MQRPLLLTFLLTILFFSASTEHARAQGCVAIRHFSSCVGNSLESNLLNTGDIQVGMNYRYFKSFRHFRGTEEEPDRVANGNEVINHSHAWDFFLTYGISERLYASVTIPTVINSRSSLYEHGREETKYHLFAGPGRHAGRSRLTGCSTWNRIPRGTWHSALA